LLGRIETTKCRRRRGRLEGGAKFCSGEPTKQTNYERAWGNLCMKWLYVNHLVNPKWGEFFFVNDQVSHLTGSACNT